MNCSVCGKPDAQAYEVVSTESTLVDYCCPGDCSKPNHCMRVLEFRAEGDIHEVSFRRAQ